MAKKYEVDGKYFLPVTVFTTDARSINPIGVQYVFAGNGSKGTTYLDDYPDLLLTAEEIYASRQTADKIEYLTDMLDYGRKKYDEIEELKSRNAELEALLKEVMATRDEAIRQNDELRKENDNLKSDCNDWKDTADDRIVDVQNLTAERDNLKAELDQRNKDFWAMKKDRDELDSIGGKLRAENENLKAWYEEANKTASEAAEANDELKKKIADLRNRVGEQLAQIQDLNAEIHFHKEFGEGLDKQQKELQARYDELDSVNKEQAEKIRKLDAGRDTWERNAKAWKMTADGMSKRAEELQAENEKLNNRNKYLESEKNRKPIVHVLTNDGHVYAFTSSGKVSVKYHTEHNILTIEDGEKAIAGFARGDKPGNLSAWWMG